MKVDSKSSSSLQFGLSAEAINSGAWLLEKYGMLQFDVPASTDPTTLNTSTFSDTIPQLEKLYGKNKPIDMHISMIEAPKVDFHDSSLTEDERAVGKVSFDATWNIEGQAAFTVRVTDAEFGFDLSIDDFKLTFQIEKLHIAKMRVTQSNLKDP